MHLGIARTSLAAWLDARASGGRLLLRIEDIDLPRNVPGAVERIMRDLAWLGLEWDEGPDRSGPRGPHVQTERVERYDAAIARLGSIGRIFGCTCSRKEIAVASAPHGASDEGPRYPGTCREGTQPRSDRLPSLRFRTEPGDEVRHRDRRFGEIAEDVHREVGDFVLRRSDGLWAYQLAVTVDDLEQGVTCVVRGADLLGSTPRQLLLRRTLAPDAPDLETLHVPLVLGADGKRLAKRDRSMSIAARREVGETPESVVGLLAASLGLVPAGTSARARDLIELWDPARLPTEPTVIR